MLCSCLGCSDQGTITSVFLKIKAFLFHVVAHVILAENTV